MPYRHTLILLLALTPSAVRAQSTSLPRATPESQGVSSSAIRQFIETADREVNSMHSFMLLRHGKVVGTGIGRKAACSLVTEQELHFYGCRTGC